MQRTKFRILCIVALLIGIPVLPDLDPVKAFSDIPSHDSAEAVIQVERNIFADVFRYRSEHWLVVLAYSAERPPQLKVHHGSK